MPKTTNNGGPRTSELPSTLRRSDRKAQRTFAKVHDSALEQYDDEARAHRAAYAALERTHEKVGDRWVPKSEAGSGSGTGRPSPGGVDATASRKHLYEVAKKLDVPGRSSMTKDELVQAIGRANDRATRRSRER